MEKFTFNEHKKLATGFKVPEAYFDDLADRVMQRLNHEEPKVVRFYKRPKVAILVAASVIGIILAMPLYNLYQKHFLCIDEAAVDNYLAYNSTMTDTDMVYLMNNQDIQLIDISQDIDKETIENELTDIENLEQYILD